MDMELGIDLELVCNLTLNNVKDLKHQREGERLRIFMM